MNIQQFNKFVAFCARCHEGQYRKDKKTPYISHPARVATLLLKYQKNVSYLHLCVAYGHDLIEDSISQTELIEFLNSLNLKKSEDIIIFDYILALSENKNMHPRKERKTEAINRLISQNDNILLILKLCDRLDNLTDDGLTKGFLDSTYLDESEILLNKLVSSIGYKPKVARDLEKIIKELKDDK